MLATVDIRPLLLKGASLALTVYPHPALRPMNDIDLLVAPEQFRAALHTLREAGGHPIHGEPFAGAYEQVTHHVGLRFHHEIDVLLELHHQWLSLPQDQAGLATWQELDARARPVNVGQARARVLGVEDQVLHLCAHMALHGPANWRLIWTYDVDQVIRQAGEELDWDALLQNAVRRQMALPLQAVLPATAARLGTPLPAAVLQRLASLPVTSGERQRYAASALGPHTRLSDGVQKLAGLEGAGARLRFAWGLALPAWSYMRQMHPGDSPARLAARYPARWAGVLGEFGRALRPRGRS